MSQCRKRIMLGILIIIGLLALALGVEHYRGNRALRAWLTQMKAQGEILSVAELAPTAPAPEDNCAPAISEAAKELGEHIESPSQLPPMMDQSKDSLMVPALPLERWTSEGVLDDDAKTITWEQMQAEVAAAAPQIGVVIEALKRPTFYSGDHYSKGFMDLGLSDLSQLRSVVAWLARSILCDLHDHRLDNAQIKLMALSRLLHLVEREPLIITQLVRLSMVHINYKVTWEAMQVGGWSETQLAALQDAWSAQNFREAMVQSFQMEQAMTLSHYNLLKSLRANQLKMLDQDEKACEAMGQPGNSAFKRFFRNNVLLPIWRVAWADQDALNALKKWQPLARLARESQDKYWNEIKADFTSLDAKPGVGVIDSLQPEEDRRGFYDQCRYRFSGYGFGISSAILSRAFVRDTQQQIAMTAIALKRYHRKHGAYPARLEELIPEFLKELPLDHMSGSSLKYGVRPDGKFTLLSSAHETQSTPVRTGTSRDLIWEQVR